RTELAVTQKALTEIRQALVKVQATQATTQSKLVEITRTGETLRKELDAEKARSKAAAAKLDHTSREAARTREELTAAQKTLAAALPALAKARTELATNQKQLAETHKAVAELRKGLDAEKAQHRNAVTRFEVTSKEMTQV